jgi:hypothetical protein
VGTSNATAPRDAAADRLLFILFAKVNEASLRWRVPSIFWRKMIWLRKNAAW